MEAIRIENLSFSYPAQDKEALREVNLTVEEGEFLALCGYSGSGKSTLLRHLKSTLTPHGVRSGRIFLFGTPIEEWPKAEEAACIGFVLQSPEHSTVTDRVWQEMAFGLENLGTAPEIIRRRTAEMAAFFGIETWYDKKTAELSGGQKQLLALASVMVMQPRVLILDEPTAQLDPIAASEFLQTLKKINRELGTTIVISEHRLEEVLPLCDRVAVMARGTICAVGTVEEVGCHLQREKNPMFLGMPAAMRVWGSVETDLPCPVTAGEGHRFLKEYGQINPFLPVDAAVPPTLGEERVKAEEVWFRYDPEEPDTVRGLSLTAYSGELLCILGGNGAGKTTALSLLAGRKIPRRGTVRTQGTVCLLPQDPQSVFLKKTVYEDLADVLVQQGLEKTAWSAAMEYVVALCGLKDLLERHPYDLSGGEQQRAALAKVLLCQPDVLLLDEPTKGLDAVLKRELAAILRRLQKKGVCLIMVSHDVEFCARYASRCALFFRGQVISTGTPGAFFAENRFYTTAAVRMARDLLPQAVTTEDVIRAVGGELPAEMEDDFSTVPHISLREKEEEKKKSLPRWRRISAGFSGAGALAVLFWATREKNLGTLLDGGGVTALGGRQMMICGAFLLLLTVTAVLLGRRDEKTIPLQMPAEKRKLPKRTKMALFSLLFLIPLTAFAGMVYIGSKRYYLTALAILIEAMLPFFLVFEGRRPKARELVIIAVLCAFCIAGRAAFFMLPQCKPVLAMTIIAGVAFGGETGFLVGSITMLLSNMLFSQGPWTPWQMFATGIIGFLAGVLYRKGVLLRSRGSLCIFGALSTFLIFGGIMNGSSALLWNLESLNWKILAAYYVTGFPMDVVHAAATVLFLWFGAQPMLEKLDRIKVKYGMME